MKNSFTYFLTALLTLLTMSALSVCQAKELKLISPQADYAITLRLDQDDSDPTYSVAYQGRNIIHDSALGYVTADGGEIGKNLIYKSNRRSQARGSWRPLYGARSEYPDNYNEMVVSFVSETPEQPAFDLIVRAYDEGVAWRYVFHDVPHNAKSKFLELQQELTEFALPAGAEAWVAEVSQGEIQKRPASAIAASCERPLLVELDDSLFVALGEAAQIDYARMKFVAVGKGNTLKAQLDGPIRKVTPFETPWRFVMAGESAGEILERNYLILNLNDANQLNETAWIKPGKVIRDVSLTTQGGKACIDFAAAHGLQYVIESAGWYGNEFTAEADATTVTLDPVRSKGPLDLQEVVRYGQEKGIGVLVYVNRHQLERQLDELLPRYKEWGIAGIKYGFVRTGSQHWSSWLHEAVRKAADHQMVLSIHDDYRPVGYSRTYPNLMTAEGIRGDEESPSNEQILMTMFTRMIAGAGDNTICYYADRVETMGSHTSQLAKSVCLYSPLTWLYWYDRPAGAPLGSGGAGGAKSVIGDEAELAFFDALPTVWDETLVIHSDVGKLGTIARRQGQDWFVGTVNGNADRQVTIALGFLDADQSYEATVYYDDPSLKTRTCVGNVRLTVSNQSTIERLVRVNNGLAIHIRPAKQ